MQKREGKKPSRVKFKLTPTNCIWYTKACCSQLRSEVKKTFCWVQGLPAQEWASRRDDAQRCASASLLASEMGSYGSCSLLVFPFHVCVESHKFKAKSCMKWSCNFISKSVIEHLGHQPQNVQLIYLKKKSSYFKNEKLKSKTSP